MGSGPEAPIEPLLKALSAACPEPGLRAISAFPEQRQVLVGAAIRADDTLFRSLCPEGYSLIERLAPLSYVERATSLATSCKLADLGVEQDTIAGWSRDAIPRVYAMSAAQGLPKPTQSRVIERLSAPLPPDVVNVSAVTAASTATGVTATWTLRRSGWPTTPHGTARFVCESGGRWYPGEVEVALRPHEWPTADKSVDAAFISETHHLDEPITRCSLGLTGGGASKGDGINHEACWSPEGVTAGACERPAPPPNTQLSVTSFEIQGVPDRIDRSVILGVEVRAGSEGPSGAIFAKMDCVPVESGAFHPALQVPAPGESRRGVARMSWRSMDRAAAPARCTIRVSVGDGASLTTPWCWNSGQLSEGACR